MNLMKLEKGNKSICEWMNMKGGLFGIWESRIDKEMIKN